MYACALSFQLHVHNNTTSGEMFAAATLAIGMQQLLFGLARD